LAENVAKTGDDWLKFLNPDSLVVKNNAKLWNLNKNIKIDDRF
jgi:hypothetical protein